MGELECSCGGLARPARTARTDHGLGLGRDEECGIAIAAARARENRLVSFSVEKRRKLRTWDR